MAPVSHGIEFAPHFPVPSQKSLPYAAGGCLVPTLLASHAQASSFSPFPHWKLYSVVRNVAENACHLTLEDLRARKQQELCSLF